MKRFKYKNYDNCYFNVGTYKANDKAIAISIENDEEPIAMCTVYHEYGIYNEYITTIKNYSENSYMTDFLKKLGIVIEIIERYPCNQFCVDTLKSKNPQSIDICIIDIDKLKEYTKSWNYNV